MRSNLFRVLAVVLLIGVAIGAGSLVYEAGATAGYQQAAAQAAATSGDGGTGNNPMPPYAYGPHHWGHGGFGFGLFGILLWILAFLLIFGLLRAAFGGGRWGGHGPWGGRGGPGGPGGPGDGRRAMFEEIHREMHRGDSSEPARPASA